MTPSTKDKPQMKNPNLPEELLIEIFSRIPPKIFGRCRCLSKSWNRNLSTSQFVKLHLSRIKTDQKDAIRVTPSDSLHTIRIPVDGTDNVISRELDLVTKTFRCTVGSCNGLVLVMGGRRELFVVNPLTLQQVRVETKFPSVDKAQRTYKIYSYGFGFDTCCDDYKIVRLTHHYNYELTPTGTFIDVYSMKKGVWKSANSSPYNHAIQSAYVYGVLVNGSIHWLALDKNDRYVIAAFDVSTELFSEFPVPNEKLDLSLSYRVYAIAGSLLMLDPSCGDTLDIWIMKEYGLVDSWTKFSVISPYDDGKVQYVKPMCFIRENEVFLISKGNFLVWNLIEGTTRDIIVDGALQYNWGGHMFVASLVSPVQSDIAS